MLPTVGAPLKRGLGLSLMILYDTELGECIEPGQKLTLLVRDTLKEAPSPSGLSSYSPAFASATLLVPFRPRDS